MTTLSILNNQSFSLLDLAEMLANQQKTGHCVLVIQNYSDRHETPDDRLKVVSKAKAFQLLKSAVEASHHQELIFPDLNGRQTPFRFSSASQSHGWDCYVYGITHEELVTFVETYEAKFKDD